MKPFSFLKRIFILSLIAGGGLLLGAPSACALLLTNVSLVNVTPSSFSVVWAATPGGTPAISVYADSAGSTDLAGKLGLAWYPLHTGDPGLTNSYLRRQNQASIRQATVNQGLVHVQVSGCSPNTTYYYRVQMTDTNGQKTFWPASGALPSVTTALENSFVIESRQLVLTMPDGVGAGSIVMLANTNSPSVMASVVGDGVGPNEVFFSLSDLLAVSGQTNYLAVGNQTFNAVVLNASPSRPPQMYSVLFTGDFLVGATQDSAFAPQSVLGLGSFVVQTGLTGTIPITLTASGLRSLSFVLNLSSSRFGNLSLQSISPQVGSAALQNLGTGAWLLSFSAPSGQSLPSQELAELAFTAASNQSSAFVPLLPLSLQAVNTNGSVASNFLVQNGRVVMVGPEPLLESFIRLDGIRQLALYGIAGNNYQIQSSGDFVNWTTTALVSMTNLVQMVSGLDESKSVVVYRAVLLSGNPPILSAQLTGQNPSLNVYGTPGTTYGLQYTTNLSGTVAWYPLLSFKLTNSFQVISNISGIKPLIIYRLQKQ